MVATDPTVADHLRSTDPDDDDAIYRVVGTDEDGVTLLRVSDADGRRTHTGEVVTVPRAGLDSFEPAGAPDPNRSVRRALAGTARAAYWSLRAGGTLMAVGALLAVAGTLGNVGAVGLSPVVSNGLVFAGFGCILLAIVVD